MSNSNLMNSTALTPAAAPVAFVTSPAVEQTMASNPPTNPLGFQFESAKPVSDPRLKTLPAPVPNHSSGPVSAVHAAFASNTVLGAPSISEQARALAGTATGATAVGQIFEHVYNNIEWEPGWGVQKGALGCLMDGMGNSFDQSLLLANLLRSAGFTANIVLGAIRLFEADYQAWWNVKDIWTAQNYCFNEYIPVVTAPTWNGTKYYMDMKHVWVQVVISGTTYVLDPSRKTYTRTTGMTSSALASALGYNATTFMNDAKSGATITTDYAQQINRGNIRSDLQTFTSNLVSYIKNNAIGNNVAGAATVDDVLGGQTITPVTLPLTLATSLSYEMPGDTQTVWTGDVPAAYKPTLQVQYPNWNNPNVWDFTYSNTSDNLAASRLTLFYDGSLVPHLYLNGTNVATGLAQPSGTWTSIYMTVTHPAYASSNYPLAAQQSYQTTWTWWQSFIYTVGSYLIANAWGNLGNGQMSYHQTQAQANSAAGGSDTSESVLGERLAITWYNWASLNSKVCDLINRIKNCHTMYSHQVGVVSYNNAGSGGTGTDLGGVVGSSDSLANDVTQTPINDTVLAMHGVALEAGVCAQMTGNKPGVSTTTVIDEASRTVHATIGGSITIGNILTLTVTDSGLPGGQQSVSYTTVGGDTLSSAATGLANAVNANSNLSGIGVTASSSGAVVGLFSQSVNTTTYSASTSMGATETITLAYDKIYKGTSSNWNTGTNVQSILVGNGYNSTDMSNLNTWYISGGDSVLIHDHPSETVGHFTGWGYWAYPSAGAFGIINGSLNGGEGKGQPGKNGTDTDNAKNEKDQGKKKDPIGSFTGDYFYIREDMTLGSGDHPYKLSFERNYNSANQYTNGPLGRGWTHNWAITALVEGNGLLAMGDLYAIQGAASIAELYVTADIVSDTTRPVEKLVTMTLADAWWVDQITQNTVIVQFADGYETYVKQPDGSFSSPLNNANKLTLSGGLYTLTTPQQVKYNFNSSNQLSTIVFPNGVTITLTYTSGKLTSVSNGLGRTLTLNYTGSNLTSVSDGNGRSISYTIDGSNNLTTFTDANSKQTTYQYDNPGRMTKYFKPANPLTAYVTNVYDSLSRVKTQSNARSQTWTYYFAGSRSEEQDPLSNSNKTYFNRFGRETREINELGFETDHVYDGLDRRIQTTLPEGNQTKWTYDLNNNVLTKTLVPKSGSGLSNIVFTWTYDATYNKPHTLVDGRSNTWTWNYDSTTGNLLSFVGPAVGGLNPKQQWKYNGRGQALSAIDATGVQTQFTYDSSTEKLTSKIGNTNWSATIGGSIHVGDVLTLTAHDTGLPGGQQSVSYTTITGDTLAKAATGLMNAVNANSNLSGLGIVAYANGCLSGVL